MDDFFSRLVVEPLRNFGDRLLMFLPNLMLAVLVLLAGLLISKVLRFLLQRFLVAVGLDRHASKSGVMDLIKKGGIEEGFSSLIATLVYWLLIVMFIIMSLGTLNVPEVNRLLSEFFLYLPNVFAAVAIVFIGYILSNFLARAALVWAVNAGLRMSGMLGKAVKATVMLMVVTMAMEQLGIGRGTMLIVFSITFGGIVLALAIALGLGGKDLAKDFLEKRMKEGEKKDEMSHI